MSPESLVVLVPILGRPQNVAPLVQSFAENGGPSERQLCLIYTRQDETAATALANLSDARRAFPANVSTYDTDVVSWPEKIAEVFDQYDSGVDWFLLAADDVTFEPGWWEATERFRRSHVQVIGTNDGANPRCSVSGIHTTHPLVHRSFRAMGESSSPVHPGYHHWHVDDELVWTAKARGVWAWCEDARITHHHPYFDESVAWDDTYALGESKAAEDRALWAKRAEMLGLAVV